MEKNNKYLNIVAIFLCLCSTNFSSCVFTECGNDSEKKISQCEIPEFAEDWNPDEGQIIRGKMVKIVSKSLYDFLSNSVVPLVKDMGYNPKYCFINISKEYEDDKIYNDDNCIIHISIELCDMIGSYVYDVNFGFIKIALIDNIPFLFDRFEDSDYIESTSQSFYWCRWHSGEHERLNLPVKGQLIFIYLEGNKGNVKYCDCFADDYLERNRIPKDIDSYFPPKNYCEYLYVDTEPTLTDDELFEEFEWEQIH